MGEHTKGPLQVGVYDDAKPALEWIGEALSYGSGPVHVVWAPEHPLTRGVHPRPEYAVVTAVTGNGPASEANACLYAVAPDLAERLERLANAAKQHLDSINEFGHVDSELSDALYKQVEAARELLAKSRPESPTPDGEDAT